MQGQPMLSFLTNNLINPILGYYDTIRKDFITATENISMDEPFPPDVLSSEPPKEKVLSLWQDLICISESFPPPHNNVVHLSICGHFSRLVYPGRVCHVQRKSSALTSVGCLGHHYM